MLHYINPFTLRTCFGLLCLLLSQVVIADEQQQSDKNPRDGSYLELGLGLTYESDPFIYDNEGESGLALFVNGRYQKNGFFIEFPHGTQKQQGTVLSFGYNFLNTQHWSFDLRMAMNHRDLDHKLPATGQISRRVSHSKLGLRVLADYDHTQLKFIAAGASGNGDFYASAWASRSFQYKNWNFYASAGVEYRDQEVVNYFYATNESSELPYYRGEAGLEFTTQFGLQYPLNEHWVIESYARFIFLPSGISNSPLVDGSQVTETGALIKYVF